MTDELDARTVQRDGTLAYGVAGDGPPVVLLHGWPETRRAWQHVWPALVDAGYRVIVPDLRGVGASDRSRRADYTWKGYADDLDAVLAAEGVDGCSLAGHDMGGVVMFEWALRNPDRVDRIAALSTSFNRYELGKSYYLVLLAAPGLGELFMKAATGSRAAFEKALRRNSVNPGAFTDADVDAYWRDAGSPESPPGDPRRVQGLLPQPAPARARARRRATRVPGADRVGYQGVGARQRGVEADRGGSPAGACRDRRGRTLRDGGAARDRREAARRPAPRAGMTRRARPA